MWKKNGETNINNIKCMYFRSIFYLLSLPNGEQGKYAYMKSSKVNSYYVLGGLFLIILLKIERAVNLIQIVGS